jgi:putative lipoprotein
LAIATHSFAASANGSDPFWGRDKALHFAVSGAMAGVGYGATTAFTDERWKDLAIGGGAAIFVGGCKEALDATGFGDPSWKDFTWDVLGAVAGLAVAWVVDVGVHGGHPPAFTRSSSDAHVGATSLRFEF